jgi:hypothetical protein
VLAKRNIENIILVISAIHMFRGHGQFKPIGIFVELAPADLRKDRSWKLSSPYFMPDAGSLVNTTRRLKEQLRIWIFQICRGGFDEKVSNCIKVPSHFPHPFLSFLAI